MEKLVILDSNSLMNRAFYALPLLTNSDGEYTNAVFGFASMLFKIKEDIKPDFIVATFDKRAPTFRHLEYGDYKAGRKKMPEELAQQFPLVKEMLNLFDINIFEIDGFEADDLIGTLAKHAEKNGMEVYIVTGDRDALQLASDNINVVITKKGITEKEIYNKNRIIEEMGVTPTEFIDVKGLMGDKSDNIPGVPGIGEKTAYKLIQTYKSVENVLNNIDEIKGKKLKENLMEYREQAVFSKKLATIMINVPVEIDLDEIKSNKKLNIEGLRQMFYKLQFKSLMDKLPKDSTEEKVDHIEFSLIGKKEEFLQLKEKCLKEKIYIKFITDNDAKYSSLSLQYASIRVKDEIYIVNMDKIEKDNLSILKEILENKDVEKVLFDVKTPYTALRKIGIYLDNVIFDVKIAAYLIESSKSEYDVKTLVNEYIYKECSGEGLDLLCKETFYLKNLYENFEEKLKENNMEDLFYNIEMPLTKVLSYMEGYGFKVDKDKLNELGEKFTYEIKNIQEEIFNLSEEEFNINSPKQLGKILFEKLDLPVIKKTKTGYSTNAEVLEQLSDKHPIIDKITYYRQLTKLYSTYVEGLKNVIQEDGNIHSSFNQTVTTTGRLSSTEPNLQNIPIKYEMGREIRKVFIPDNSESLILSADYSQIELRVLADIADDENLINAFKEHSDIHTKTASEVFGVPIDEVTSLLRGRAKAVNFGIVYGISDFSLAKDLGIAKKEAKQYMDIYFERYPKVKDYLKNIVEEGKEKGYVTTIVNRRRYIPEINASNKIVKSLGERLAMNTPIQGSAADIIKLAMIKVFNELQTRKLKSKLILQVHDELIINVYKDELKEVEEIVKTQMENVMNLDVPLEIDMNIGNNWYEAK
ncbi:DNA polymerase I [Clostridium frigidicarnis]|uniref:DNA polymerase I n=1 Tax=Clostridium frigidicarnis TaxID=84698 RepID=A0A1I1A4R5_9CLOT|nr:DNA polymerase I [Clostridium frigidicarnis]SFB31480.1 DNA polymerase I [Clostridium frigidicarnis]